MGKLSGRQDSAAMNDGLGKKRKSQSERRSFMSGTAIIDAG